MPERRLKWSFDGRGEWEAESAATCDGIARRYRIQVCEDGSFDCSRSDPQLIRYNPLSMKSCKNTFAEAVDECVGCEYGVRDDLANGHLVNT